MSNLDTQRRYTISILSSGELASVRTIPYMCLRLCSEACAHKIISQCSSIYLSPSIDVFLNQASTLVRFGIYQKLPTRPSDIRGYAGRHGLRQCNSAREHREVAAHFQYSFYFATRRFPMQRRQHSSTQTRTFLGPKSQVRAPWRPTRNAPAANSNLPASAPLCRFRLDPQQDRISHPRKRTVLQRPGGQAPRR